MIKIIIIIIVISVLYSLKLYGYKEQPIKEKKKEKIKNNTIYRPLTFDSYIGQEKVKLILKKYIEGCKEKNKVFPHTLICGNAGCGKTTLARIISNELKICLVESITTDVEKKENLLDKIKECGGGILFLDEVHALKRESAESIYSIMEDFKYNGENIQPFTLIGATTELGEIIKDKKPFYDRFKIILDLNDYNSKEIIMILSKYNDSFLNENFFNNNIYKKIAINSKLNPRKAIRLLEACSFFKGDIDSVLSSFNIIKDGYTNKDIKTLELLKNKDVLGLQNIVSYLDTSIQNYLYEIEPFLLKTNLIIRTPRGRKITNLGISKLETFKRSTV